MTDVATPPTSALHSLNPPPLISPTTRSNMSTRSSDGLPTPQQPPPPPQEALTPPSDDSPRGRLRRKPSRSINTEEANHPRLEELSLQSPSYLSSPNNGDICICPAPPRVPRPRNAFILYRQAHQAQVVLDNPGLPNPQISKKIGEFWSEESEEVKNFWKRQAEEEKERHKIQHPYYKYQPRRNQKGLAGRPVAGGSPGEEERCPNCHKRRRFTAAASTPRTPSTPFVPAMQLHNNNPSQRVIENSHMHHQQRPSGDMAMYGGDRDRDPRGSIPQYANQYQHRESLRSIDEDYDTAPSAKRRRDDYETMSPSVDSKRVRRFTGHEGPPDHHRRSDTGTPIPGPSQQHYPQQQQFYAQPPPYHQHQQNQLSRRTSSIGGQMPPGTPITHGSGPGSSLPRPPPMRAPGPSNGPMAPPPRPARNFPGPPTPMSMAPRSSISNGGNYDESLTLAPLQIPTSPNQASDISRSGGGLSINTNHQKDTQARGIEAMVMSIPYTNKLSVLRKISPPLGPPSPASPAVETRGPVIAIEGCASDTVMRGVEKVVERAVEASGECVLKVWRDSCMAAASVPAVPRASAGGSIEGADENKPADADVEMRDDSSSATGKDDKGSVTSRSVSLASVGVGSVSGDAVAKPFGAYLQTIMEWHAKSEEIIKHVTTKKTDDDETLKDAEGEDENGKVTGGAAASERRGSSSAKLPVALIAGGFSLTLSDKFACTVAITDPYSPVDHWQWMCTLWRGIVGPDLVIYVRSSTDDELSKLGVVEYKSPGIMVVRVNQEKGLEEKTERRLAFEVMEWVRAGGFQSGGE